MKSKFLLFCLCLSLLVMAACTGPGETSVNEIPAETIENSNVNKSNNKEEDGEEPAVNELTIEEAKIIAEELVTSAQEFHSDMYDVYNYIDADPDEATYYAQEAQYYPVKSDYKFKSIAEIKEVISSIYSKRLAEQYIDIYLEGSYPLFKEVDGVLSSTFPMGDGPMESSEWGFKDAEFIYNSPIYTVVGAPIIKSYTVYNEETEDSETESVVVDGITELALEGEDWLLDSYVDSSNNIEQSWNENTLPRDELVKNMKEQITVEGEPEDYYFDLGYSFSNFHGVDKESYRVELKAPEGDNFERKYFYFVDAATGDVLREATLEGDKIINPDFESLHPNIEDGVKFLIGFWDYSSNIFDYDSLTQQTNPLIENLDLISKDSFIMEGDELYLLIPKYLNSEIKIYDITQDSQVPYIESDFSYTTFALLVCNPSDLHSNARIDYETPEGELLRITPQISLDTRPPKIQVPEGVEDITEQVYEVGAVEAVEKK